MKKVKLFSIIVLSAIFFTSIVSCDDDECNCSTEIINPNQISGTYILGYVSEGVYQGYYALTNVTPSDKGWPETYFVCNPEKIKDIGYNQNDSPIKVNIKGHQHDLRYDFPRPAYGIYAEFEIVSISK
jgi:hypothetical protein